MTRPWWSFCSQLRVPMICVSSLHTDINIDGGLYMIHDGPLAADDFVAMAVCFTQAAGEVEFVRRQPD